MKLKKIKFFSEDDLSLKKINHLLFSLAKETNFLSAIDLKNHNYMALFKGGQNFKKNCRFTKRREKSRF